MRRWLAVIAGLLAAFAVVLIWWLDTRAENEPVAPPREVTPVVLRNSNPADDRPGARAVETTATGDDDRTPRRPDEAAAGATAVDAGLSRSDGGDRHGRFMIRGKVLPHRAVERRHRVPT